MAGPTPASGPTSKTPGIGRPAATRSYACFVSVETSWVMTTRPWTAAHSRTVGSSGSGEPGVLDADDVEVGFPAKQSPDDVAVEVLVCRESQHRTARC